MLINLLPMTRIRFRLYLFILLSIVITAGSCSQQPEKSQPTEKDTRLGPDPMRFSNVSIRTEKYLLPAVTTGPLDPEWSPDGKWIVFSMRGDIWKIPSNGGMAIALTQGPNYHFEPDWSPDGKRIAFTVDQGVETGYGIGVINADGNEKRLLVKNPGINIEPEWHPDGNRLFFVSDRGGSLDIFEFNIKTGDVQQVVTGPGNQIQPALSPTGSTLAYISPVSGKPGSGGIWIKSLPDGIPTMIHYEDTRHRAQPTWTPDGVALLYVTEITGNNDIGTIPADGGAPVWLTHDQMNELSPSVSPDGDRIAFVSNRAGTTDLYTMPFGGGLVDQWNEIPIDSTKSKQLTGRLHLSVLGQDGDPVPARIYLEASDGRSYAPDRGFHRIISAGERHYFHTTGNDNITVPAGEVTIDVAKGYEYQPVQLTKKVNPGEVKEAVIRLERFQNPTDRGWYSGETHAHDLHGGRFGLSHESFFKQLVGEDLHVTNSLIHMDGTRVMGRLDDLTGRPHPLSTDRHILQYGEEFRGSRGHIGMLGIKNFVMPLVGGQRGTAYKAEVLNTHYIDETHSQGGIAGFMHPYGSPVNTPSDGGYSEIPLDVALGKGDFYDVLSIPNAALDNAAMYYRLLNSGFELSATGGSDNFADVWRDPPAGTTRTYAYLGNQELSVEAWLDAVKAGHTFATNGPLLYVRVDGKRPGDQINLTSQQTETLQVEGEIASIASLDRMEVLLNGEIVKEINLKDQEMPYQFSIPVNIPDNGWIAVRALGPYHKHVLDSYPFVQTTPVYIHRNGQRYTSPEDALFLRDIVDELWKNVEQADRWDSKKDRERYRIAVEKARNVYIQIANGNFAFD